MIRPASFRANEETIHTNFLQKTDGTTDLLNQKAQVEFDNFVTVLRNAGVRVIVIDDDPKNDTPDALFPVNLRGLATKLFFGQKTLNSILMIGTLGY